MVPFGFRRWPLAPSWGGALLPVAGVSVLPPDAMKIHSEIYNCNPKRHISSNYFISARNHWSFSGCLWFWPLLAPFWGAAHAREQFHDRTRTHASSSMTARAREARAREQVGGGVPWLGTAPSCPARFQKWCGGCGTLHRLSWCCWVVGWHACAPLRTCRQKACAQVFSAGARQVAQFWAKFPCAVSARK